MIKTDLFNNLPKLKGFWKQSVIKFDNSSYVLLYMGPLDMNPESRNAYNWISFLARYLLPLILLLFFNFHLIKALRESQQLQESASNRSNAAKKITPTLICIIILYILLMSPSALIDVILEILPDGLRNKKMYLYMRSMANTLQVCNFAVNFCVYLALNGQFRRILIFLFRCRLFKIKVMKEHSTFETSLLRDGMRKNIMTTNL